MSIEAMKQALEALETLARYENPETRIQVRKPKDGGPIVTMYPHKVASDAATALRAAIEQAQKQEAVAWMHVQGNYEEPSLRQLDDFELDRGWEQYPLYTAPRQWVGLTNKDIIEMWPETSTVGWDDIRLIEAKLKEKNA
jgi:hypothetical protein